MGETERSEDRSRGRDERSAREFREVEPEEDHMPLLSAKAAADRTLAR